MATGRIQVDEGSTTNLATNTFSEDAVTKHVNRSVLNTSAGVEAGTSSSPLIVDLGTNNDVTLATLPDTSGGSLASIATSSGAIANAVSGSEMQVDIVSSVLPTGASTAAKQPALGTAGAASADVLSVQGIASMTPLSITGTVTANAGTNLNTSALALETGGNLAAAVSKLNDIDTGKLEESTFTSTVGAVSPTPSVNTVMDRLKTIGDLAATIDADTSTLSGTVSGSEIQVDVVASLPAGTNAIGKLAANSGVDIGDVDILSIVPGTGATNLGKAEDSAHTTGDVGVLSLGVRNDALASLTGTNLDYSPISVTADGSIITKFAPTAAMRRGSASTTGTSDTSLLSASGDAGLRTYLVALQVMNTGSSTAVITLKDGSGGSTIGYAQAPAGSGANIYFPIPLRTTANTALFFAANAASTTVYIAAQGYDAP